MSADTRRAIEIDSYSHVNPIPFASRVGPLVISGNISGLDAGTGELPAGLDEQVANLFAHMAEALAEAGAAWSHVAKINFSANRAEAKEAINRHWLETFPDRMSRPARQTRIELDGMAPRVTCDFVAYVESPPD